MSKKTVIIHGGFHKTASSTIQHSLGDNRSELKKQGFSYPLFEVNKKEFFNRSLPASALFMDEPEKFRQYWYHNQVDAGATNKKQWEIIDKELECDSILVISDEFISSLDEESLFKVRESFESRGCDIRVINYVREPLSLIVSTTQQMARTGNRLNSRDFSKLKRSGKKIRKIQSALGVEAEFHSFERACQHKDGPAGYFFDLIGFKYQSENIVRVNEGISAQAVNLLSYINELQPLFIDESINPLRRRFDSQVLLEMPGDKYYFTEEQAERIKDEVNGARMEIKSLLGEDFFPEVKTKFIQNVTWNEEQLNYLNKARCELDLNLLIKIADYLADLKLDAELLALRGDFTNYVAHRLNAEKRTKKIEPIKRVRFLVGYVIAKLKKSRG